MMTIWYEMFIEPKDDGIVYDVIKFDDETEEGYWGEEIIKASDDVKTWEHAIEDIAIFSPSVIKVDSLLESKG